MFFSSNEGWVVGGNSTILHTSHGGFVNQEEIISSVNNQSIDATNYPNPFSRSTTIKFASSIPSIVEITIFNRYGQAVDQLIINGKKGNNEIVWNAGSLPAGLYVYRVLAGNKSATGKMVINNK